MIRLFVSFLKKLHPPTNQRDAFVRTKPYRPGIYNIYQACEWRCNATAEMHKRQRSRTNETPRMKTNVWEKNSALTKRERWSRCLFNQQHGRISHNTRLWERSSPNVRKESVFIPCCSKDKLGSFCLEGEVRRVGERKRPAWHLLVPRSRRPRKQVENFFFFKSKYNNGRIIRRIRARRQTLMWTR